MKSIILFKICMLNDKGQILDLVMALSYNIYSNKM